MTNLKDELGRGIFVDAASTETMEYWKFYREYQGCPLFQAMEDFKKDISEE